MNKILDLILITSSNVNTGLFLVLFMQRRPQSTKFEGRLLKKVEQVLFTESLRNSQSNTLYFFRTVYNTVRIYTHSKAAFVLQHSDH